MYSTLLPFHGLVPSFFFFFNDTATTEIYTLSLHDALPISRSSPSGSPSARCCANAFRVAGSRSGWCRSARSRSEEHTSELQSLTNLVCRLLLEKKTCRDAGRACAGWPVAAEWQVHRLYSYR